MPIYTSSGSASLTGSTLNGRIWQGWSDSTTTSITATAGSNAVWGLWNGAATATTTTGTLTTAGDVFRLWTNGTAATTSSTNSITWGNWVDEHGRQVTLAENAAAWSGRPAPQITEEQRVAQAARQEQRRLEREEKGRLRSLADERAMKLLRSTLSDQQNRDLRDHGHFFVDAPSGRRYRIDKGRAGNVKQIDKLTGTWMEILCIHPRENVPNGDTMLVQKLLIETSEETFRAHANITKKGGGYDRSVGGLLTGEKLGLVLPFKREREQAAA